MVMGYTLPGAEENIIAGVKIHTMRTDRLGRWIPGRKIHHSKGVRSANYRCFLENKCVSTQMVLMVLVSGELKVTVDRNRLDKEQIETLAKNDGFENAKQMVEWFFKPGQPDMWAGKIIHWTKLKY